MVDPDVHDDLHDEQKQQLDAFLAETGLTDGRLDGGAGGGAGGRIPPAPLLAGPRQPGLPPARPGADRAQRPPQPAAIFDDRERPEGMLAFLNACQTAEAGQTGSFLDVLHSFGFTGAIATEQQTIDNFANELGLAFLRGFLQEGRPLGELLHGLRLKMAPLGLLYGAHCPPEIRVKIGADGRRGGPARDPGDRSASPASRLAGAGPRD